MLHNILCLIGSWLIGIVMMIRLLGYKPVFRTRLLCTGFTITGLLFLNAGIYQYAETYTDELFVIGIAGIALCFILAMYQYMKESKANYKTINLKKDYLLSYSKEECTITSTGDVPYHSVIAKRMYRHLCNLNKPNLYIVEERVGSKIIHRVIVGENNVICFCMNILYGIACMVAPLILALSDIKAENLVIAVSLSISTLTIIYCTMSIFESLRHLTAAYTYIVDTEKKETDKE